MMLRRRCSDAWGCYPGGSADRVKSVIVEVVVKKRLAVFGLAATGIGVWFRGRRREIARVSPELRRGNPLLYLPLSVTNQATLTILRRLLAETSEPVAGVGIDERTIVDGPRVVVYTPDGNTTGVLVWIHGGGRVAGRVEEDHLICSHLARASGVRVVSVDYRLAPEHPFPAAIDDIMAAIVWVRELPGVDPARIAVGGASAGGGLAAEAAQRATDEGVPLAFQLLVYPMLDDRTVAVDAEGRGQLVWTAASNRFSWGAYLNGALEPAPYAVAARRTDFAGLPPAWIGVGDLDLFYGEDVEYARRLRDAGVPVDLDVVPGMYHAADVFIREQPPSMQAFWARMAGALEGAIGRE